jgi:CBS domain-containing protein
MLVRDVMSTDVIAVTVEDRATDAIRLLVDWSITGLPVIDGDGHVLGVISELDLIRALRHGDLYGTAVGEVMHWRPLFVEPDTRLFDAVALMEEWQVRRLPVCERGRLVGIVSRGDVLRALAIDYLDVPDPAPRR